MSENLLAPILRPNLKVVFVGAAPSRWSALKSHWYAGPASRFYWLLHRAGFTPRQLLPEEDGTLPEYGIGLACMHPDRATTANHLLPEPSQTRREMAIQALLDVSPQIICYNGKDVFRMYHGCETPRWGLLPETLGDSLQFVVISASGRADRFAADRLFLFEELKRLSDSLPPLQATE